MPDAAKNSGSALDSGEGDIVGGIKLGTHTGRLCDPDGTISASASCRVHQKVRGITLSLFFLATRIFLWSWGEWSGIPSVSLCMTKGNVFDVAFEKHATSRYMHGER